jgi:hypothetical protein
MDDIPDPDEPALTPEPLGPPEPAAAGDFWGDGEAPAAPRPARRRTWRTWLVAGVGAAAIGGATVVGINAASSDSSLASAAAGTNNATGGAGAFGPGGAGGQPGGAPGQGPGAGGTITAIDGSTVTIKDLSGSTTKVVTTSSTTVTKTASGALSDIQLGDHVVVTGTGTASKIAAQRVDDLGATSGATSDGRGGPGPSANANAGANTGVTSGTVAAIDGSTLTVTVTDSSGTSGASITITTSSATTYTVEHSIAVSDLAVGDQIMVVGTTTNGAVAATRIRDGVAAGAGGGPMGGPPGGGNGGNPGAPDARSGNNA